MSLRDCSLGRFLTGRISGRLVPLLALPVLVAIYAFLPVTFYNEVFTEPLLMMRGLTLYRDLVQHHGPGLRYLLVPLHWLFPAGDFRFFACIVLLPAVTAWCLYSFAARHLGARTAVVSFALYLLMQPLFAGHIFWLDACNGLLGMAAAALASPDGGQSTPRGKALVMGLMLGTGVTIKQTFFAFLVVFAWLFLRRCRWSALFGMAVAVPAMATILAAWASDSLWPLIDDAVLYNVLLRNRAAGNFAELGFEGVLALSAFGVIGVPAMFGTWGASGNPATEAGVERSVGACALVSMMPVFPRFAWEHFQQALPFVAIILGSLTTKLMTRERAVAPVNRSGVRWWAPSGLVEYVTVVLFVLLVGWRGDATRISLGFRGFREAYNSRRELDALRAVIAQITFEYERIYIWGSDFIPGYVLASRMPAAKDVYPFPWMFDAGRCITDLETTFARQGRLAIFLTDSSWEKVPALQTYLTTRYDMSDSPYAWLRIARHK